METSTGNKIYLQCGSSKDKVVKNYQNGQKRPKTNNFVQCYSCWLFRGTCGGDKVGFYRSKTK